MPFDTQSKACLVLRAQSQFRKICAQAPGHSCKQSREKCHCPWFMDRDLDGHSPGFANSPICTLPRKSPLVSSNSVYLSLTCFTLQQCFRQKIRDKMPLPRSQNGFIAMRSSCYGDMSCLQKSVWKCSVKFNQHKDTPYLLVNLPQSVLARTELQVFPAVKKIHLVKLNNWKNTEDNGIPSIFEFDT